MKYDVLQMPLSALPVVLRYRRITQKVARMPGMQMMICRLLGIGIEPPARRHCGRTANRIAPARIEGAVLRARRTEGDLRNKYSCVRENRRSVRKARTAEISKAIEGG